MDAVGHCGQVDLQLGPVLVSGQLEPVEAGVALGVGVQGVQLGRLDYEFGEITPIALQLSTYKPIYLKPWMGVLEEPVENLSRFSSCS